MLAAFIEHGDRVFGVVLDGVNVDELIKEFGERFIPIVADVTQDACQDVIRRTIEACTDRLDILVNNAGVPGESCDLEHITSQEMIAVMDVNCFGVLRVTQAVLPMLKKSQKAIVLNMSSRMASLAKTAQGDFWNRKFSYAYRVSKAAQNMLTICMNEELKNDGIGVIAIHPGKLNTRQSNSKADMTPQESAEKLYRYITEISTKDYGKFIYPYIEEYPW